MPFGICIFLPVTVCVCCCFFFSFPLLSSLLIFFSFWWLFGVFLFNLANHKQIIKYSVAAKWKAKVYHHIQHPACAITAEKLAQRKTRTLHEGICKGVWHREGRESYFSSMRNQVWDGQALPNSGLNRLKSCFCFS